MRNYKFGKIYQISCKKTGQKYVGSTTEFYLKDRLKNHERDYSFHKKGLNVGYLTSYIVLGGEDYEILLIESFPCDSQEQLEAREKHFIRAIECVNKVVPQRTRAEYRDDKKKQIKEYSKAYASRRYMCSACETEFAVCKKTVHERTKRHLLCVLEESKKF